MKKFGLKAIAGGLALMLAASLVVPATAAAEENVLLSTTAENVLLITQDMVDEDGEIVLSGENFDKVVLPNDVEIDGLYIDNCEIGEFTLEGGNDPAVELWDVKIDNVLVTAPALIDENEAITEYLDMMKGKESTKEFDIDGFVKDVQNTNKRLSSMVPKLSLKGADMESSEQTIGAIKLAGNVNIDLGEGKLPGELTVAFKSAQEKMDVTIENYEGSLNVFQSTEAGSQFGIVNVKTKNCKLGTVNVNSEGNANVALRSADSTIVKVNYNARNEGAGVLTLATPTDVLNVEETAVNATVKLISPIVNADIKGERIDLNIGPKSSVQHATIAGVYNRVTGNSSLKECVIPEGHTASIEVAGAKIDGDNVYSPRISIEVGERPMRPEEPSDVVLRNLWDDPDITVEGNKMSTSLQYKSATYDVPEEYQNTTASVKIVVASDDQVCVKVIAADGETVLNNLNGWGGDDFNYGAGVMTKVTKIYRVSEPISRIDFMSCKNSALNVTVYDIEFTEASGDGDEEQSDIVLEALWSDPAVVVDCNKATITGSYKTAAYTVPADIKDKVTSVTIEVSSDAQLCVKVVAADGETVLNDLNGWGGDDFNAGVGAMTKVVKTYEVTEPISRIDFMSCTDGEMNVEVHDIEFTVAEGEVGGDDSEEEGDDEQSDIALEALYGDAAVVIDGNKATITGANKAAYYAVPAGVDGSKISGVKVVFSSDAQICVKVKATGDVSLVPDDYPNWGVTEMTETTVNYEVAEGTVAQIEFMSLSDDEVNIEVKSVEFTLREAGIEGEEEQPSIVLENLYGDPSVVIDGNKATITAANQTAYYAVPGDVDGSMVASVKVVFSSDAQICVKVKAEGDVSLVPDDYPNWGVTEMTQNTVNYAVAEGTVAQIEFMALTDDEVNIVVESVEFTMR